MCRPPHVGRPRRAASPVCGNSRTRQGTGLRRGNQAKATPYYGDADLSGATTVDDFTLFLIGYQHSGNTWVLGDFDYSGLVTLDDFTLFLAGYQQQGAPLSEMEAMINSAPMSAAERQAMLAAVAAVPEPHATSAIALGSLALSRRRRRRSRAGTAARQGDCWSDGATG